jgi:DNA polymerase-3 subunit gamma/tau
MSTLALARKYRPKTFSEVYGQNHVTSALKNAVKLNRLHHAYLFTGARGVGKTTIARILAKTLNCENLQNSEPCLQCESCIAIDSGTSLDFIEIDGASKTRVEDTKEIIDNISYATAKHHYKLYLIDEVHMLSLYSFNALLKTLEEPPAHVKFILATTEPHKIPVTILSRCLKFNLTLLTKQPLVDYLASICEKEKISTDPNALDMLSGAAKGSVRDALTLLEQAMLFNQDNTVLSQQAIEQMLGIDPGIAPEKIINAIMRSDIIEISTIVTEMVQKNISLKNFIEQLLTYIHHSILSNPQPELLKIFDVIIKNKEYLSLAPTEIIGLEMLLISAINHSKTKTAKQNVMNWDEVLNQLELPQPTASIAEHLILLEQNNNNLHFTVSAKYQSLINESFKSRLQQALSAFFNNNIGLKISIQESNSTTPATNKINFQQQKISALQQHALEDPFLESICKNFNATMDYIVEK